MPFQLTCLHSLLAKFPSGFLSFQPALSYDQFVSPAGALVPGAYIIAVPPDVLTDATPDELWEHGVTVKTPFDWLMAHGHMKDHIKDKLGRLSEN